MKENPVGVVGVGGLLLGDGVSWHTARTGFACDSVVDYELVLASGEIVHANATARSDLFRALKGGGSNFGIVTSFHLETFPATDLVVGRRSIGMEHIDAVIDAVAAFTDLDQAYHGNALLSAIQYRPDTEASMISVTEINTLNRANNTAFDAVNRNPTLAPATTESLTLAQSANSSALGVLYAGPVTIANDPRVMRYCAEQHESLVEDLKAALGTKAFSTILDFQPLASGANMLGLERPPHNRILFVAGAILTTPNSADRFPQVYQKVAAMVQRIEAFATSVGSHDEFVYPAYADAARDPLGSYGAVNVQHIRDVAKRYDPDGFFPA
ncbi:FAD binding domain-containing protein [Apiospora aurea]|uniref:FAD binding domain-containing protein n=1 Tax=Apiospora aurea TaxID=335848 RepID=A0ABR1PY34_9PEZI